jgi:hypothetical protein
MWARIAAIDRALWSPPEALLLTQTSGTGPASAANSRAKCAIRFTIKAPVTDDMGPAAVDSPGTETTASPSTLQLSMTASANSSSRFPPGRREGHARDWVRL